MVDSFTKKTRKKLANTNVDLFSAYDGEGNWASFDAKSIIEASRKGSNSVVFDEELGLLEQEMDKLEHNALRNIKEGGVSSGLGRGEDSYKFKKDKQGNKRGRRGRPNQVKRSVQDKDQLNSLGKYTKGFIDFK